MALFQMNGILKNFPGVEVLRGISVAVEQGEVVAIIGPSGSGKSTLLRCAALLETIDDGDILYHGRAAARSENGRAVYAAPAQLREIRRSFGLVFQDFNLFPHYSVLRNITGAVTVVQKRPREQAELRAGELLALMDLTDKADAYPCQLSGGQQQRVSIARALALDPEVLFFDEPTSSLDPELTGEILSVIRTLAARKMTMVIVTHEIAFAKSVADRVIFMSEGLIVEQGTPDAVIGNPQNPRTQAFLGKMLSV